MANSTLNYSNFGPLTKDYQDYFDFTPLFGDTILSITPSVLFLAGGIVRVAHLSRRPRIILARRFQLAKQVILSCYVCLQIALVILWNTGPRASSSVAVTSSTLALITSLVLCVLSYLEHARNIRPSTLVIGYLLFSVAFDALRLRPLWQVWPSSAIAILSTTSLVLKGLLLTLEACEKTRHLPQYFQHHRPEESSSILNRGVFYWLNRLLWQGANQFLAPSNLYELDDRLASAHLTRTFLKFWAASKTTKIRHRIAKALLKTLKWALLAPIIPRLILLVFTVCQPLLLQTFLTYSSLPGDRPAGIGRGLIASYSLLYFGIAVSNGFYWYLHYRALTMTRGCLVGALQSQMMKLDLQAIGNPKTALTLMSNDIQQIEQGMTPLHEFWTKPIQIAIATYLLSVRMGIAAIAPVAVALLSSAGTAWISTTSGPRQNFWMQAIEHRINLMSSIIPPMKEIKMKGLSDVLHAFVTNLRTNEMRLATRFRMLLLTSIGFAFTAEIISPAVTFLVYFIRARGDGQRFDATQAFTSLSLIQVLTQPLNEMLQNIPLFFAGLASLRRIEEFLCTDEQQDFRDITFTSLTSRELVSSSRETAAESSDIPLVSLTPASTSIPAMHRGAALEINDGCFGWADGVNVLNDINLSVPQGKLTMVVGPVACGKSTLCKVFLGETRASKGKVNVNANVGRISFCDQTPFLHHASIKENIVGTSDCDETFYHSVLHAAALEQDIAFMSEGDKTMVGTNGANLSGGQRHKVAFARALFARNQIMVLDDIFSGLDPDSAEHIFRHGIGPQGLARRLSMTVVLATHAIKYLHVADHIIALQLGGNVAQEGSYADLRHHSGYVSSLVIPEHSEDIKRAAIDSAWGANNGVSHKEGHLGDELKHDMARQQGDLSIYAYYFSSAGLVCCLLVVGFSILTSTTINTSTMWLKFWTDSASESGETKNTLYLSVYMVLQFSGLAFLMATAHQAIICLISRSGMELHRRLLETSMNTPLSTLSKTDSGSILNRFSQDLNLIDEQLPFGVLSLIYGLSMFGGQIIIVGISSPLSATTFPVVLVVLYVIQKFYLKTSRQMRFLDIEAKSPLYTHFTETLTGLATIRAFGWTRQTFQQGQTFLDKSQQPAYLLYMIQRWLTFVLDTVVACMATVIAIVAIKQGAGSGFAGVALSQVMNLNSSMATILIRWTEVETSIGAVSRIKSFCQTTPSEHKSKESFSPPDSWPERGSIKFENVTAAYDEAQPSQPALKGVSLTVEPGQKVGICGRSGSGKSSTILTLFHMLELIGSEDNQNTIFIDGVDILSIPRNTLRSRLNVLPQHPVFFHGTVRRNLNPDYKDNVDDSVLTTALAKVGLASLGTTSDDLNRDFEPATLSAGQRQLFALASAIVRKEVHHVSSKIVVLDEVTSNLDHETDALIQRVIREEFKHCTVIAVAHRLATIIDFDKIVVMNGGRVEEVGTPRELLALGSESAFGRMWATDRNGADPFVAEARSV